MVVLACAVIILAGMRAASTLVVAIVVAFIVTVLAGTLQHRLLRRGWPRLAAFLVVLLGTVVVLAIVFWTVQLSLSAFVADLPSYREGAQELVNDVLQLLKDLHINLTHVVHTAEFVQSTFAEADTVTRSVLTATAGWTVVLVLVGFMLYEALDYPEKIRRIFGDGEQYRRTIEFVQALSRFMGVQTIGAVLTAAGDFAILAVLGIPSALLWAGLAFFLSYIPSIGAIVIVIPPTIATLVRFGFARALIVLVLMLIVDNVVGVVVVPRLIGLRIGIAPFWGMLSLVVWGWVLGPAGAILAVPLTMMAKFLLESTNQPPRMLRLLEPFAASERVAEKPPPKAKAPPKP
ncbi:MAG: AI-2E family transporter [Coriobacteriia bacterium]